MSLLCICNDACLYAKGRRRGRYLHATLFIDGMSSGLTFSLHACYLVGTRAASTPAALEAAGSGVTAEAVLSKARMTALLSACAAAGHGEVALAELQKALDVSDTAAVQSWVVKAIGTKLVEGRVDSVRGVLSVARSTHPSFGGPQWKKLGAQIAALKDTVGAAVAAMSAVKPPPHVSARGVAAAVAAR